MADALKTTAWPFPSATLDTWLAKLTAEAKGTPTPPYAYEPGVALPRALDRAPIGKQHVPSRVPSWGVRLTPQPGFDLADQQVLVDRLEVPLVTTLTPGEVYPTYIWPGAHAADPLPWLVERGATGKDAGVASEQAAQPGYTPLADTARVAAWGATAVQQLAWGVSRLQACDSTESNAILLLSVGPNWLFEVAKLRAARLLLATHGVSNTVIWAETDRTAWAATDPTSNIVRQGLQGFAAVVGGCDRLFVLPHTPTPDSYALRLCCTLPHVLLHEAQGARVADPLAGAYAIEELTASLVAQAGALVNRIAEAGGLLQTLRDGWLVEAIKAAARRKAEAVLAQPLVGVSTYQPSDASMGKVETTDYFYPAYNPSAPHLHPWGAEATLLAPSHA